MSLTTLSPLPKSRARSKVWHYTFSEFVGPDYVVSDGYSIRGDDISYEVLWDFAGDQAQRGQAVWVEGPYSVHRLTEYHPEGTFILLHDTIGPVGFYTDGQCWINEEHRGNHLSTPLILAATEYFGGRPYGEDIYGFSEAGIAAHAAAYCHAIEAAHDEGLITSRLRDGLIYTAPFYA